MNGKNKIICKLFVILFISLFISCGDSFSSVEKTSVTIRQFESYAVTDMDDLDAAFLYSGTTSDSAVASLREGKYIYGNGIGTADITVTDGNTETVYNVTVTQNPEHNFQPAISETRGEEEDDDEELTQEDCYIGYCYNAFSGKEFDQRCVNDLKKVFDWDKIIENQNYFIMEDTPTYETNAFLVGSKSQYITSHEKQFSASVSAKFMGNTLYSKKWSNKTLSESEASSQKEIGNVYVCARHLGFYLNDDGEGYWKYLLPEVQEDLKNLSPEQFINKYGTHVILGTSFGQSFEANYMKGVGDDFKTCIPVIAHSERNWYIDDVEVTSQEYINFLLNYDDRGKFYEEAAPLSGYPLELLKKWAMQDVLVTKVYRNDPGTGTVLVIGGPTEEEITSLFPIRYNVDDWTYVIKDPYSIPRYDGYLEVNNINWSSMKNTYDSWFILNLSNYDCDRLVGPWNEYSLLPVWELLESEPTFDTYGNFVMDWKYYKEIDFRIYAYSHAER